MPDGSSSLISLKTRRAPLTVDAKAEGTLM